MFKEDTKFQRPSIQRRKKSNVQIQTVPRLHENQNNLSVSVYVIAETKMEKKKNESPDTGVEVRVTCPD